jgi:hypothetical protein
MVKIIFKFFHDAVRRDYRLIILNTLEREVPPLKDIGKWLGMENKWFNTQHIQISFSKIAGGYLIDRMQIV